MRLDCLFEVVGISDEVGLKKPDRRFLEYVLERAGCEANETVMVGDRIDNDIAPAQELGMKTVQIELDLDEVGYQPVDDLDRLYVESLRRVQGRGTGLGNESVAANRRISRIAELPGVLKELMGAD
jgi:FMN phosphatase YigB (HAD superfamily)